MNIKRLFVFLIFIFGVIHSFSQQNTTEKLKDKAVNLFIDCFRCDMDYIRREIPYVNYVRDVKEADLYIRESRQTTGSGGREYTYSLVGQERFEGKNDTLVYASGPNETEEEIREGRTNMMKMGLMRYVAQTPTYKDVNITHTSESVAEEVTDKWNNWVFEIETSPRLESEESYKEFSFRNSFDANKITEDWKIEVEFDHRLSRTKYTYDNETFTKEKTEVELENLVVKSLGQHWSIGARVDLLTSSFSNIKFRSDIFPSLEYNLFPYSESSHRQLRFLYGIGASLNQYNDTTIYGKTEENLAQHQLQIAYRIQEKWGSVNISLEGSNYLHDFSKHRLELGGNLEIRIFKGLSLDIFGSIARIHDQLSLVRGELSEADLLLQLQELATAYSAYGRISLSYTFGSIYNNVVNPRFGNGRW
ncbi:MAG: hypothetical protein ACQETJ_04760 [Bacteroidota bacterium]